MKQIIFISLACIIMGCSQSHRTEHLLGIWDAVSSKDIDSEEVYPEEETIVEFKPDSLYLINESDTFLTSGWNIKGDSILLDDSFSVYIIALTNDKLIVEYDFLGKTQLTLKKRK